MHLVHTPSTKVTIGGQNRLLQWIPGPVAPEEDSLCTFYSLRIVTKIHVQ